MTEVDRPFPDNAWFDGKIASWEGSRFGYRYLFEVIAEPNSLREQGSSAGDDEIVELYNPTPGQSLSFTILGTDEQAIDMPTVTLDEEHPTTILPKGTRYIMEASSPDGVLAYTCICYGQQPLRD